MKEGLERLGVHLHGVCTYVRMEDGDGPDRHRGKVQ